MTANDKARGGGTTDRNDGETGDDGFLRRWSRRKGAQRKTAAAQPSAGDTRSQTAERTEPSEEARLELPPEAPVPGRMITSPPGNAPSLRESGEAGAGAEEPDAEIAEEDLPDVEDLDAESDFTPFLKKGVSEQLQRRALRKLWLSDPVLANVDGLLDYGDDFTDAAMVIENMKTVYTVGRGMVPKPADDETEELEAEEAETPETEEFAETEGAESEFEKAEPEGDEASAEKRPGREAVADVTGADVAGADVTGTDVTGEEESEPGKGPKRTSSAAGVEDSAVAGREREQS